MNLLEIFFLAVALSVDAAVCSIIGGKKQLSPDLKRRCALSMAGAFGAFQFMMPVAGFYCGESVMSLIEEYDHWVGFALLAAVSLNMLKEAILGPHEEITSLRAWVILSLAVATSIDALAVGFSIALIDDRIFMIAGIIGIVCFSISLVCFLLGAILSRFKSLDRILNVLGAMTLMGIGIGILYEHGVFAL